MIQQTEGTITVDFELKKGHGPSGTVIDPDGKPVRDAEVACVPVGRSAYIDLNQDNFLHFSGQSDVQVVHTNREGLYHFQPPKEKYTLIAATDQAVICLNSDQVPSDGQLKLQKWARIEGDCRTNDRLPQMFLSAHIPMLTRTRSSSSTMCNLRNGRTRMPRVTLSSTG